MYRHIYNPFFRSLFLALALFTSTIPLRAEVRLAGIFSSDMVLQRGRDIVVWGWAAKGERVSITFNKITRKTKADASGKWKLTFPAMEAGGPYDMKVEGKSKDVITLDNILIGDVWICSGQSNMGLSVKNANNAEKEIAEANHPLIRLMDIPRNMPTEPADDIKPASWMSCSPESVPSFSAAAYYFGRNIYEALDIPIGLVHTSWGGSNVEAWTSMDYLTTVDKYKAYPTELADIRKEMKPGVDIHPNKVHTSLFNGMIHPLTSLPVKGVIWYQGESNAYEGMLYRTLFPNMIACWREKWHQPDLPFLFVQLPNYMDELPEPGPSNWAMLREAQLRSLSVPNTAMTVAIDVGESKNIHPKDKQTVGLRLALNALRLVYDKPVVDSGPMYESMRVEGSKIIIRFKHVEGGMVAKDKYGYLKAFTIAGPDKKFHWATAMIKGDEVVVYSGKVSEPVAVRYAWADNPADANLYNAEGLPASPFRTDEW